MLYEFQATHMKKKQNRYNLIIIGMVPIVWYFFFYLLHVIKNVPRFGILIFCVSKQQTCTLPTTKPGLNISGKENT